MREADPTTDHIAMVESQRMLTSRTWQASRLHLLMSAAAHHAQALEALGFTVHRRQAQTVTDGLRELLRTNPELELWATEPRSRPLQKSLRNLGARLVDDDSFLTPRVTFESWSATKLPVMETFYRQQRTRLNILMDGSNPLDGRWNFDAENRLPPPKAGHPWPTPLHHDWDELDHEIWQRIIDEELPVIGSQPDGTWATTRAGALRQLQHFLTTGLAGFGPYEDAVPADSWAVNHSLLSPYLNLGLLDPGEVVDAAVEYFEDHPDEVPLASIEAFVRQVIGWREFVNGAYWATGEEYEKLNALNAYEPLPLAFDNPELTQMQCIKSSVTDVHERGWAHHIPRLMILSNLALTVGVDPGELLAWMRRMFVDAADWVMVPNIIGMGAHADGGVMMTKPYASGGAYISRMTRHCADCPFNPKKRTGQDACPFTTLYWDFLGRNSEQFRRNPRISAQVSSAMKLADGEQVRERADEVRARLRAGTL
jgi:deoxyribodipyrimidine photolyase-related protein